MMQHDPESSDEEPAPVANQPTHCVKTSPVKPSLAARETLDKSGSEKPGVQPALHRIEAVKPRVSSRRRNAPNRYSAGVMISTVAPHEISVKKQEIDEKKQVKEELITKTEKLRSKKN